MVSTERFLLCQVLIAAAVYTPQHLSKWNIQIYTEMYVVWVVVVYRSLYRAKS